MMFPKIMSEYPLKDATELTTNSGAEVPNETIVKPMTKSDILFFFAKDEDPFTNQLAPNIKQANPTKIKREEIIIFLLFGF